MPSTPVRQSAGVALFETTVHIDRIETTRVLNKLKKKKKKGYGLCLARCEALGVSYGRTVARKEPGLHL